MESMELSSRLFVFVDERREGVRERERRIGQGRSYSGVFMSDATFALSYEAGAVAEAGLDRRYRYPSADKMASLPYIRTRFGEKKKRIRDYDVSEGVN